MAKGKSKVVLCVAKDSVCLCQVANQSGRAFIISSQVVSAERFVENKENWLREALETFKPKLLKQVADVLVSTTLTHYIPLEIFYLREENFAKTTLFELEHSLGDKISQFKFGVYRTGENNMAHIFLAQKTVIEKLDTLLASVGIRKAKILLSPVMFIEEGKRQIATVDTIFLNVGRSLIAFVFRKGTEIVPHLFPMEWGTLAQKISKITNQNCSEEDIYQLIKDSQKRPLNQPIQSAFDEFFEGIHRGIIQRVEQYFGPKSNVLWVVGGRHDRLYGIGRRLVGENERKIIPYNVAFKQQISPSIEPNIVAAMESFVPGILATATLDKKRLADVVNLQTDTIVVKEKTEKSFFYPNFVASLACVVAALLYCSQYLNCQYITSELQSKKLLAQQNEMVRIAGEIEEVDKHIKEQKKLLGDVLVYIEQNRKWCELFNALQNIFAEAGDVYLTSFAWDTKTVTAKGGGSSAKKATGKAPKKTVKGPNEEAKDTGESVPPPPNVTSTIAMMGSMFIGDVAITKDAEREFNDKFNAMFDKIRRLAFCAGLGDIKVNVPENSKITFRCNMEVNLKSKIMAL
jgi:hypothetical protein